MEFYRINKYLKAGRVYDKISPFLGKEASTVLSPTGSGGSCPGAGGAEEVSDRCAAEVTGPRLSIKT